MNKKSILVANNHLERLGGSETFTYALIESLVELGYDVEYFTFSKGIVSNKIEKKLGIRFMTKKNYDLILANHNTCVRYLSVYGKIIQTCHGIYPKLEQPSKYADGYVAISNEVQDYLEIKGFKAKVILNGINCERFYPKIPINTKLKKVLSLCQSETANKMLSDVCVDMNIEFTTLNKYVNGIWNVENEMNQADLVVGLGRSAYEAMACGRAVLIFDNRPYFTSYSDGYVKKEMLQESLYNNCSGRRFKKVFDSEDLKKSFLKYDSEDGTYLRQFALENLNIKSQIKEYLVYSETIEKNNNIFAFLVSKIQMLKMKKRLAKKNN